MANYNSEFTGPQVDEAIQQVLDNHEDWSNKADPESVTLVAQAVVALQTAMNGKADLTTIFGAKRLNLNQVPLAFITYRNASATFPGRTGENNVTWLRYTDNLYRICYHNNGEDVVLGAPQNMLYYSGNGIYTWSGSQFQKIVDLTDYFENGRLKMDALPENLPAGGGMSDDVYSAIKDNVDLLRARLNTLISNLANLAFSDSRTSQISNAEWTSWPENSGGSSGGDTPSGTPSLTVTDNGSVISNGATIDIGTATPSGVASKTIRIKGTNLNSDLSVSLSNDSTSGLGVSPSTITVAAATNGNGAELTLTYGNAGSSSLGQATGTLNITSADGINMSFSLTARYQSSVVPDPDPEDPTGDTVNVTYKLLNYNQPSGTTQDQVFGYYKKTINKGSQFSETLTTSATPNNDVNVFMGGVVVAHDPQSGSISINNVTGDIEIVATAHKTTNTIKITTTAAVTGGVSFNGGSAQDLDNGDTYFDISAISRLIFSSDAKTAITSIDFGGAVWESNSNADSYGKNTFNGMINLLSVKGLVNKVSYKYAMFQNCTSLTDVDTIGWGLSGTTSISVNALFKGCTALTKIDVSHLITSNHTNLYEMFSGCSSLATVVGLSTWNMSNVTSIASVFANVPFSGTTLDLSAWTCSGLTNITNAFNGVTCSEAVFGQMDFSQISSNIFVFLKNSVKTLRFTTTTPPNMNETYNMLKGCRGIYNSGVLSGGSIVVPTGRGNTYKTTTGWTDFAAIITEES